jgi:hypothetical protein
MGHRDPQAQARRRPLTYTRVTLIAVTAFFLGAFCARLTPAAKASQTHRTIYRDQDMADCEASGGVLVARARKGPIGLYCAPDGALTPLPTVP